jgi:integrase
MTKDKLTDRFCRTASAGKHSDGAGMYLLVMPEEEGGGRYWRQKYRHGGKEKTLAHGVFPDVTLKEARDKRDVAKKLIAAGVDPIAKRRDDDAAERLEKSAAAAILVAQRATLFSGVAESYFEKMHRAWSATHCRDVRRIIDRELVPALGAVPMRSIKRSDIQVLLDQIVKRGALTFAKDVRMYFRAIHKHFNAAQDDEIPDPSVRTDLPNPPAERGHAALAPQEIGPFLRTLQHSDAGAVVRIAVRMLLLTAVRTTELRAAKWDEFHIEAALWRVPGERMKARRGHVVPLSPQVLALLAALRLHTGRGIYLFPNGRDDDRPMSENAVLAAIKRMGYQARLTGHGMRAMFSTWAHEAGYKSDAVERQLAHAPANKVKAAYLRSEFMDERVVMLRAWADWLDNAAACADVTELPQYVACL